MVWVSVSLRSLSDVIPSPGAVSATHLPKLEESVNWSSWVLAPTAIPVGTRDGEDRQAFAVALPAAIAYVTPLEIEVWIAWSSAVDSPAPARRRTELTAVRPAGGILA
jgi:hypothetical protein